MPRYPFTPEYLDGLPEPLTELFRELELSLLEMICGRLASGRMNEVSVQAIRALRAHGVGLEEIERAVRETARLGREELERIIDDTVERNRDYYGQTMDFAGLTAPEYLVSPEDVEAIRRQTVDKYRNITGSMGFLVDGGRTMLPPARAYQWALDGAEMRITSGAVSYEAAIRDAVRQLAGSGIKTAEYESGHVDQIDVAVRRAALTGVRQVNRRYTERAIEELGTDLVEVSAHIGARDVDGPNGWENHKAWQGKVYRLSTTDAIRAAGAGLAATGRAEKAQLLVGTGAEMTRRRTGERGQEIIDKPTYNRLTRDFVRRGGIIIRGEEAARHLDSAGAFASYISGANVAFIRDDASVTDVLEEMYHAEQDRTSMFGSIVDSRVFLLREIDAQKYLINAAKKYKIPLEEQNATKRMLAFYEEKLAELEKGEANV